MHLQKISDYFTLFFFFYTECLSPCVYLRLTAHLSLNHPHFKAQKPPVSRGYLVVQTVKNLPAMQETWVQSLGQGASTPVFLPRESHGQRSSLVGYNPWGQEELDMTDRLSLSHTFQKCVIISQQKLILAEMKPQTSYSSTF